MNTPINGLMEITRSFSFKLNIGDYQNIDFFCSQKCECHPDNAAAPSKALHAFCKQEVMEEVNAYCREHGMREYLPKKPK